MIVATSIIVALLSFQAIVFMPLPGADPPADSAEARYVAAVRALAWVSAVLFTLAIGISIVTAWLFGIADGGIPDSARQGLLIFAALLIVGWLFFSVYLYSFLRFSFYL